jgi:hypothetical protein
MGASKAMATAVFGRVSQFFRWSILSPWHNKGHNRTVATTKDRFGARRSRRSALSSVDPA